MSLPSFFEKIRRHPFVKGLTLSAVGAIVVLLGTYGAWRLTQYFSPEGIISPNNPIIKFRVSDHSGAAPDKAPLPNNFTDTTDPNYSDTIVSGPTKLRVAGDSVELMRIQGEVEYR